LILKKLKLFSILTGKTVIAFIIQSNKSNTMKCPVCVAAKKDDVNHYVKDKKGKTICPTLLSQRCNFCGQIGHTPKYCKKAQESKKQKKNEYEEDKSFIETLKEETKSQKNRNRNNVFNLLTQDSDEEEEPSHMSNFTIPEKPMLRRQTNSIKGIESWVSIVSNNVINPSNCDSENKNNEETLKLIHPDIIETDGSVETMCVKRRWVDIMDEEEF